MEITAQKIDELLTKPCYIIDFLPQQVPPDTDGQFFDVENYLLHGAKRFYLRDKFVNLILKLMCYYPISLLYKGWIDCPAPQVIDDVFHEIMNQPSQTFLALLPKQDTLIVFAWDCLNLSVYNPPENLQSVLEKLSFSEGLYWRKAQT